MSLFGYESTAQAAHMRGMAGCPLRRVRFVRNVHALRAALYSLALLLTLMSPSYSAGASVTGSMTFTCRLTFPVWPTAFGSPVNCSGTASGLLEGKTTTGASYQVQGVNVPLTLGLSFYNQKCTAGFSLNGTGGGTFQFSGLTSRNPPGPATASLGTSWTTYDSALIVGLIPPGGTINLPSEQRALTTGTSRFTAVVRGLSPEPSCNAPGSWTAEVRGVLVMLS